MPTPTPSQPAHGEPLGYDLLDIPGVSFVLGTIRRAEVLDPDSTLCPSDVVNGTLRAVELAGIDLASCADEAEVIALMLAFLTAGRRAIVEVRK